MIRDLTRVLRQLSDAKLWQIILKAALAALALLTGVVAALTALVASLAATGIGWLDALLPWFSGAGGTIAALLLLPLVAASVLGLFADEVAAAVEARWYPSLAPAAPPGLLAGLVQTLRLLAVAGFLNLCVLPLYLLLPGLNIVLFIVLNGYLFGREYFETVAVRRMAPPAVAALRRQHRGQVMVAGMLIASVALVPVVNLLVPVLGTALMVHRRQRLPTTSNRANAGRKD